MEWGLRYYDSNKSFPGTSGNQPGVESTDLVLPHRVVLKIYLKALSDPAARIQSVESASGLPYFAF